MKIEGRPKLVVKMHCVGVKHFLRKNQTTFACFTRVVVSLCESVPAGNALPWVSCYCDGNLDGRAGKAFALPASK
jgi:hypothetical protein